MPDDDDRRADEDQSPDELSELRRIAADLDLAPDRERAGWSTPPAESWDRIAMATGLAIKPAASSERRATRRDRTRWVWVGAAAAAVIALIVTTVAITNTREEPTLVASAALAPLGPTGSGNAELVEVDGDLQLQVDTSNLDAGDGFLELWVIDPDVTKLVSLGPLRADGRYDLPPGLDPEEFPVVDVSVEPIDGDPTHSGDSLLRGQLEF